MHLLMGDDGPAGPGGPGGPGDLRDPRDHRSQPVEAYAFATKSMNMYMDCYL